MWKSGHQTLVVMWKSTQTFSHNSVILWVHIIFSVLNEPCSLFILYNLFLYMQRKCSMNICHLHKTVLKDSVLFSKSVKTINSCSLAETISDRVSYLSLPCQLCIHLYRMYFVMHFYFTHCYSAIIISINKSIKMFTIKPFLLAKVHVRYPY